MPIVKKLTDEKQRLLDHISTTQTELESTDHLCTGETAIENAMPFLKKLISNTQFDHSWSNTGSNSEYSQDAPLRSMEEPFAEGI